MLRLDETRDKNASPRRELCPENFYPIGFAAVLHSDESVRRLNKGPERPINPEHARKGVLMALKAIDAVVVFGDDTPLELIKALEPDVWVKGGDYDPNETDPSKKTFMGGSTEVRASGGEVIAIPLVDGFSTTNIVRRMRD